MRFLIQNIQGWGAPGRRTQLKDIFKTEQVDIIGLQETIKQDFSAQELHWLEHGGQFN
jgi:exonuclease III